MAAKQDPAAMIRQARDLIEGFNHVPLDEARTLSAPALSDAVQALKQLMERLPQAFEQTADVLELLAARGKVVVQPGQDPQEEVDQTAAELREAAVGAEDLARTLANPASALFMMGGR
ncbi:hypothetical protein [Streptomyces sp. NPDC096068]|uniref:hypothetical protein n=1 Tax=Streptomyces sp. NPDC096068 TaxID=3155424 RepID=UPI003316D65A